MKDSIAVSVIIVNYNTKSLLSDCLRSIYALTIGVDFEVIVSDNGSTDGSAEMLRAEFPQVVLLENNANLGFGKANNVAAKIARGKYLFFLNSDTVLLNNAVKAFWEYGESCAISDEHVFLGCLLRDADGNIVHSYERFTVPAKGLFRCVVQTYPALSKISALRKRKVFDDTEIPDGTAVQFIIGADLFVLASDFKNLQEFDEHFFMYFEDDDLCRRASANGIECRIIKSPSIVHLESRSTKIKSQKICFFERSFLFYAKRYYSFAIRVLIRIFFFVYSFFRLFDFRFSFAERKALFINVIKAAWR